MTAMRSCSAGFDSLQQPSERGLDHCAPLGFILTACVPTAALSVEKGQELASPTANHIWGWQIIGLQILCNHNHDLDRRNHTCFARVEPWFKIEGFQFLRNLTTEKLIHNMFPAAHHSREKIA